MNENTELIFSMMLYKLYQRILCLLVIFLFFQNIKTFCQKSIDILRYNPHGTLIVGVICEDGIIIASDSRGVFTINNDNSQKVYAYYNNNQKIFPLGRFQVGISGLSMLNKKTWKDITTGFTRKSSKPESAEQTFNNFTKYLKTKTRATDSIILIENQYIIAGYENSEPILLGISSTMKIKEKKLGGMVYSDKDFRGYLESRAINMKITCANIASIIEPAFKAFADYKNDHTIGSPIYITQINSDNTTKIINSFEPYEYSTYKKLAKAILKGKIEVHYIYSNSKKLLEKTLLEGIKLGY